MNKKSKIYVAGHNGMVGSAIVRELKEKGYDNLVVQSSRELDLIDQEAVNIFFKKEKPEFVFLAAAKVGGILANNKYRGQFLYENLMIQSNVIHASYSNEVKKLLFLGSSCIYPKFAKQPISEDSLLTSELESTNEPYAIAKIAGVKLCEAYRDQFGSDFISVMPTNLYGPNDNYDLNSSHVLPALIRKFHLGMKSDDKSVTIWGSGKPLREFLHVNDLAFASLFLMEKYSSGKTINVGYGEDISIYDLAVLVKKVVGFKGDILLDPSKPDGTPRKILDSGKIRALGWAPRIDLEEGIRKVYLEVDKSKW